MASDFPEKVVVVVVTYNRLALLQKALASIGAQTAPLELIVVNNDSTDGTREWLDAQTDFPVIHQGNVGGAGGFKTGMAAALERGADWVWMMDDDVTVDPDCLEKLLSWSHVSKCLHPRKQYADGPDYNGENFFNIDSALASGQGNISFQNGKEIMFVNTGSFEGMLVHRSVIEKIGLPDDRFFIVMDDMIYGWEASLHTNVCYVRDAVMHTVKRSTDSEHTDFYLYHYIRNRHLVVEHVLRHFPHANKRTRQLIWGLYLAKLLTVWPLRHRKGGAAIRKTYGILWRAWRDGRQKKTGKTF